MVEVRFQRQATYRASCTELMHSREFIRGGMDKTPNLLITPFGTKMNRVAIVGFLRDVRDVSNDGSGLWVADVEDTTGRIRIQAGQYDPTQASQFLSEAGEGIPVLIIGKTDAWEPEDGQLYPRVRVQAIREIAIDDFKGYMAETLRNSYRRFLTFQTNTDIPEHQRNSEDVQATLSYLDRALMQMLGEQPNELEELPSAVEPSETEEASEAIETVETEPEPIVESAPEPETDELSGDEGDELSSKVMDYINNHADSAKGVAWDDITGQAEAWGVTYEQVEDVINQKLSDDELVEPTLGIVKLP